MGIIRSIIWLCISFVAGKAIAFYLSPQETVYMIAVFIVPFIVLGFHDDYYEVKNNIEFIRIKVFSSLTSYRQLTFYGIPIGDRIPIERRSAIFGEIDGRPLIPWINKLFRILPAILSRIFLKRPKTK